MLGLGLTKESGRHDRTTRPDRTAEKMDKLVHGADCARHPLIGCVVGHSGGDPNEQARNFLRSLWRAAEISTVDGESEGERQRRIAKIQADVQEWLRRLTAWEAAGNSVAMPRRMTGHHIGR